MQTKYVVDTTVIVSWLLSPDKLTAKIVRSLELELSQCPSEQGIKYKYAIRL
ncbi:MAG: hypothetical protein OK456_06530 [Thaumarchaeota archaeon]|nr:hypothetical protein [Nitrososphaerota archaeon]